MLKKFWEKEPILISFSGVVATIGALFLDIPKPADTLPMAQSSLATIQVFWLVLFTICLIRLFYSFIRLVIEEERAMQKKYDMPFAWPFSITLGGIFLTVIASFWQYIFSIYIVSISEFISMVFPGLIFILSFLLLVYVEKNLNKFTRFSYVIIMSFILSTFVTLAGIYSQQAILGYFYFYWTNRIYPILFLGLIIILIIIAMLRKKSLWELLSPKIKVVDDASVKGEKVKMDMK